MGSATTSHPPYRISHRKMKEIPMYTSALLRKGHRPVTVCQWFKYFRTKPRLLIQNWRTRPTLPSDQSNAGLAPLPVINRQSWPGNHAALDIPSEWKVYNLFR